MYMWFTLFPFEFKMICYINILCFELLYVFEFLLLKRLPNNYSFCINLKVKGFDEKIKRNLAYILTHRIIFKKSDNG